MAQNAGLVTFLLTDLDTTECSPTLIRKWFGSSDREATIPEKVLFRIAEREVEAWLLADQKGLASFLKIAPSNFTLQPDDLPDPKQHLLNVIRTKGRKRYHKEMLPGKNSHIGSEYNPKLCKFVRDYWDIDEAALHSKSLKRALAAISRFKDNI